MLHLEDIKKGLHASPANKDYVIMPVSSQLQGRNRRCITVDMRQEEGRQIIKELANQVDVLVENFRPGVMEKWKLGPKVSLIFGKLLLPLSVSH